MSGGASVVPLPELKKRAKEKYYSRYEDNKEDEEKLTKNDDVPELIKELRKKNKPKDKES